MSCYETQFAWKCGGMLHVLAIFSRMTQVSRAWDLCIDSSICTGSISRQFVILMLARETSVRPSNKAAQLCCCNPFLAGFSAESLFNTWRPGQNNRHFADDILQCIFVNENLFTSNNISLKCVPYGVIDNMLSLVQMVASCRIGDKPLLEPMRAV